MMADWGMSLWGWIWMGAWIVTLLALVWLLVGGTRDRPLREDALDILRARFARGELSQEEYERARTVLLETERGRT